MIRWYFSRIAPDDFEAVTTAIERSLAKLSPWCQEFQVDLPSLGRRWLRAEAKPEKLESGGARWAGYLSDVSADRSIQEAALDEERRLALAASSVSLGIWDLDLVSQTMSWNPQMYQLYGADPDTFQVDYESWFGCIVEEDRSRFLDRLGLLINDNIL